jgi:hypothetical protein
MCLPWIFCPSHTRKHAGQCVSSFTISQLGVQEGARARVLVVATALSVFLSYTYAYGMMTRNYFFCSTVGEMTVFAPD